MSKVNFQHMLNLQMDEAFDGRIAKRCSQYYYKNLFGQMIESDTKAFQSPSKLFAPAVI